MKAIKSGSKTLSLRKSFYLSILFLIPVFVILFVYIVIHNNIQICLFKNLFNIKCFGCGMTRAIYSIMEGNFYNAFLFNKISIFLIPIGLIFWIYTLKNSFLINSKKIN